MSQHVSIERMNESLDGLLSSTATTEIEEHMEACAACRNEYARLSETVREIRSLPREALAPEGSWEAIAARIGDAPASAEEDVPVYRLPTAGRSTRRISFSVPQLAAAGVAVALLSAGLMWMAIGGGPDQPPVAAFTDPPGGAAARAVSLDGGRYTEVVGRFEQILDEGRDVLRPETLLSIEESLATIDDAIAEVESALTRDPNSELLQRMLASHQRTRLSVLQRAAWAVQAHT